MQKNKLGYLIYVLKDYNNQLKEVYTFLANCQIPKTKIGEIIGLNYYAIARKLKLKTLTNAELIKILEFIEH